MAKTFKTKYPGVYYRLSSIKKHEGKPERVFYIVYQNENGKQIWEKVGVSSIDFSGINANQIRTDRMRAVQAKKNGEEIAPKILTFKDIAQEAEERHFYKLAHFSDFLAYRKKYFAIFDDKTLSEINPKDIESLRNKLQGEGKCPGTIINILNYLKVIFNLAIKWDMFQGVNPVVKVSIPRVDDKRSRYLSKEEAQALLEDLKKRSPYVYGLAIISLFTGMRLSETINLRGEHINLENKTIKIVDTKTKNNRVVYIGGPLLDYLRNIPIKTGKLLLDPPKWAHIRQTASKNFKASVDHLGLNDGITDRRDKVVFHTLRHTFASWLASQGQSLYTIGTLLGHSSPEMTKRYAHLLPEAKKAAIESIDAFFGTPPEK
ncbi:MAG: site-specific integrase [Deltaproteobacteria bacterium]|jgi:integrase|nr:site-specific integrase [Deltaproteobacteria bacterium]